MLRQIDDNYIIVPTGSARLSFNGMISFNATGALIWRSMESGMSKADTARAIVSAYDVSEERALSDIDAFCKRLKEAGLVEQ